jgi:hypothetical protein
MKAVFNVNLDTCSTSGYVNDDTLRSASIRAVVSVYACQNDRLQKSFCANCAKNVLQEFGIRLNLRASALWERVLNGGFCRAMQDSA